MIPFIFFQIIAIGPDSKPVSTGTHLETESAVSLVTKNKALFCLFVYLADNSGQLIRTVFSSIRIVPLKSTGSQPDTDGQGIPLNGNIILVIGKISGTAVQQKTAAFDSLFPPLGVLVLCKYSMGQSIILNQYPVHVLRRHLW